MTIPKLVEYVERNSKLGLFKIWAVSQNLGLISVPPLVAVTQNLGFSKLGLLDPHGNLARTF